MRWRGNGNKTGSTRQPEGNRGQESFGAVDFFKPLTVSSQGVKKLRKRAREGEINCTYKAGV